MAWAKQKLQKLAVEGGMKARTDANFRKLALSNPAEAIKQITGEEVPEGFKVRFVDNAGAHLTIVLPDLQHPELNDSDLESVAGGQQMKPGMGGPTPGEPGMYPYGGPGSYPGKFPGR